MRAGVLAVVFFAAAAVAQEYRAYWVDAFHPGFKTPAEVDGLVQDVARSGGNAIFLQVRRRADSYYRKTLEVPAQDPAYDPSFDALAHLINRARARRIEVHAWFVVYPVWPSGTAPPVDRRHLWHAHGPDASGRQMWMQVSATGEVTGSLDPGHPDAQRYLVQVILDPLRHYALDGIHLDYIRYSDEGDYGWNPWSVERFSRQLGRSGAPSARDPEWAQWRRDQVTGLVRQIYLRAIEQQPTVKVSAALISWGSAPASDAAFKSTAAYSRVYQDWRSWIEEGILDLAMPMHYFVERKHARELDRWLAFGKARQFARAYLPGLGAYLNEVPATLAQVDRARRPLRTGQAPVGVALYSHAGSSKAGERNRLLYTRLRSKWSKPAAVPNLRWKSRPALGHVAGNVAVENAPEWWADAAEVRLAAIGGASWERTVKTDGTGFFGFVDVPPGRYRLTVKQGPVTLHEGEAGPVVAGRVTRADVRAMVKLDP